MDENERAARRSLRVLGPGMLGAAVLGLGGLYFYPPFWTGLGLADGFGDAWTALWNALWIPGVAVAVVWLPLFAVYWRGIYPPRGPLFLLIMLVSQSAAVGLATLLFWQYAESSMAPVRAQWLVAADAMKDALAAATNPDSGPLAMHARAVGDPGAAEERFRSMLTGVRNAAAAYRTLSGRYLDDAVPGQSADAGSKAAADAIARAHSGEYGYNIYLQWIVRHGAATFDEQPALPPLFKAHLLQRFYRGVGDAAAARIVVLDVDDSIFSLLEGMTQMLGADRGRWTPSPQGARFAQRADQDAFNYDLARLTALRRTRRDMLDRVSLTDQRR
jgi:hypothetical protein